MSQFQLVGVLLFYTVRAELATSIQQKVVRFAPVQLLHFVPPAPNLTSSGNNFTAECVVAKVQLWGGNLVLVLDILLQLIFAGGKTKEC